jgi:hypothetical protein
MNTVVVNAHQNWGKIGQIDRLAEETKMSDVISAGRTLSLCVALSLHSSLAAVCLRLLVKLFGKMRGFKKLTSEAQELFRSRASRKYGSLT